MTAKPPITIRDIDHVVLRVRDVDRIRDFYCSVLGCSLDKVQASLGLVQLRAGCSLIDLASVDGEIGRAGGAAPGREGRNMDHFCLRIEAFDAAAIKAHLAAHGVSHGEVAMRYGADGSGPSVYIVDPEGNTVELKGPPVNA
jgi:glyoxylase I family protein